MCSERATNWWRTNGEYVILWPKEEKLWRQEENPSAFPEFWVVEDTRRTALYAQRRCAYQVSQVCSSLLITPSKTSRRHSPTAYISCRHREKRSVCVTRMGPGFRRLPEQVRRQRLTRLEDLAALRSVRDASVSKRKTLDCLITHNRILN